VPEASGCATYDEIRLQAERLSERDPFAPPGSPAEHTIAGVIEPYETTWRARIALRDAAGRELGVREVVGRSPTCRTLNVPVALVIVTLADSLLGPPPAGASGPGAEIAPPSIKPRVTQPGQRDPEAASEAASDAPAAGPLLGLGAFGALDLSVLPSATPGLGVALELRLGMPISIDAAVYAPVDELDAQGRGARFYLSHGGIALCPELEITRGGDLRAQLCAGGQIGAISAGGQGLTHATSAERLIVVLGFEPKLVWHLTERFTARASIAAGWVLVRPRFRLDIEGQAPRILESGPVALQMRVGVMGFAL
jgi:hypothetical protein